MKNTKAISALIALALISSVPVSARSPWFQTDKRDAARIGAQVGEVIAGKVILGRQQAADRASQEREQQEAVELIGRLGCTNPESFPLYGKAVEFMVNRNSWRFRGDVNPVEGVQDAFARCGVLPLVSPRDIADMRRDRSYGYGRQEMEMPDFMVRVTLEEVQRGREQSRTNTRIYDRNSGREDLVVRVRLDIMARVNSGRTADYAIVASADGFGSANVGRSLYQRSTGPFAGGTYSTGSDSRTSGYFAVLAAAYRAVGNIRWYPAAKQILK